MDREYKKERKEITDSIEKEHACTQYMPWGKPGGGAPALTTRRTRNLELKEKTNYPGMFERIFLLYHVLSDF